MNLLPNITELTFLENYCIRIKFDNQLEKIIDYTPFIKDGVSKELTNIDYFRQGKIDDGYLVWPNGYDCCPQFLFQL